MWSFCLFAVIALSVTVEKSCGDFPSSIHKCGYGDTSCISQTMQYVISNFAKTGVKEINLIPFDPLNVKSLKLSRNPSSPVNIELSFKDIEVLGLEHAKVKRLRGFGKDPSEGNEVEITVPKVTLKGPYAVDGNVLILPIVGKGNSEIILDNVVLLIKSKNKATQKNGKTFIEYESVKMEIKPQRVHFNLENLFNGNKELGDNMNKFINENWSEIFNELQPAISEAFALIIKHLISNVFAKYPYEQYFESA